MKAEKLFDILEFDDLITMVGNANADILGLSIDSRSVGKGDLYIALKGSVADGHRYIPQAIANGAVAILCEELPADIDKTKVYVRVRDTKKCYGQLAHSFFGDPSEDMEVIGVTGTNGKTTVTTLLHQLYTGLGYKVGLISTIEIRIGQEIIPSTHTTPNAIAIAKVMKQMKDQGCTHVFMEVSSHAVDQKRIGGVEFDIAAFTNISHDHLDYHKTFKSYIEAKKAFFDNLSSSAYSLINIDDKNGKVMVQNTKSIIKTCGLKTMADYKCKILSNTMDGLQLKINEKEAFFRLSGDFNAYNLTMVYGIADLLGEDNETVLRVLSSVQGPEGRLQKVHSPDGTKSGVVDYAHTPDALENVIKTLNATKSKGGSLIVVVGCGGDRDKTKRPIMAKIAASLADRAIFTSDNPRTEDANEILADMLAGLSTKDSNRTLTIEDRELAIKTAVVISKPGDIILVAGKGHEKYQEINGERFPFEDKEVLLRYLEQA